MRVFVTGASGHIGSALIPELLENGHEVVGLARSDRSAAILEAAGAEARRGDLDDLDGLHEAARSADGVVHLAFKHEAMAAGDYLSAIATTSRRSRRWAPPSKARASPSWAPGARSCSRSPESRTGRAPKTTR